MTRMRIGDALVDAGLVASADVESAAVEARAKRRRIGEMLVERKALSERELYRMLALTFELPFCTSDELIAYLDPSLGEGVPKRFQDLHAVLPVARDGDTVTVATSNPADEVPELAAALDAKRLRLVVVTPTDLQRLRMAVEGVREAPVAAALQGGAAAAVVDLLAVDHEVTEAARRFFDQLLLDAVAERASDIHVETYGGRTRLRLRVDGDLRDLPHYRLTEIQRLGMINVIKVRAGLDISERRLPQGGRFETRVGQQVFDVRTQTQPCLHGEHVVMRLLPQHTTVVAIDELGFPPALAAAYRRLLDSPGGLVLVVGPTGSGKSTTLYAGLQQLAADTTRKVITVEDPIEYALEGIQQTQVKPEIGFEFASAMRAFVREDPDVILVGEIRDGETALEALRASQTGHLVLSTLHCNDTVDAVQRLVDLGMHRNSIAAELLGVFSQRLAKRLCALCRVPDRPADEALAEVYPDGVPEDMTFWKGQGCDHCANAGTLGRTAVLEYLPASSALRLAIARGVTMDELRGHALDAGLMPMRDHALALVRDGVIAFDQLRWVLTPERMRPDPPRHPRG
jgi:type IV pilus assembly protein PilB